MRWWSRQNLAGVALASLLLVVGACGGGAARDGTGGNNGGTAGSQGTGGSGTGTGGIAGTPATGCGHTCAQYAAECGMVLPDQCDLIYDCGRCREPLVCGAQGVPNRCARPGTWTIDHSVEPLLYGNVTAIWGTARNDVWAGDSWGTVIWFDGTSWDVGADFGVGVTAIHGSSFTNVWFGLADGTVFQLVGTDLIRHRVAGGGITALWVGGPSDVFACDAFLCWQWDGQSWSTNSPNDTGAQDAWGIAGGPLWVVSNRGWMARRDGQVWTSVFEPGNGIQFLSIRGLDTRYMWAAGTSLMNWNGSTWNRAASPGQLLGYFMSVWPSGPRDVWAVGTEGLIQHGDGMFFETEPSPTTTDLLTLWGSGPNDIWAGGGDRVLLHYTNRP